MTGKSETQAKPPFVYWTSLWLVGFAFALVGVLRDIFQPDLGAAPGRDFANLYTAGKAALNGVAWQAFDVDMFRLLMHDYLGVFVQQNYSYPPYALFIAAPFAALPYWPSFVAWTALGIGLFYFAAKPHVPFRPALAVLTPAAALNIWMGHYGLLLGALWLFFFRARSVRAGLIASLMTIKPHMGLFIGLTSLRDWRTAVSATAGVVVLVILSIFIFRPASWYGYVNNTFYVQIEILTRRDADFYFRLMPDAYTAFGRGSAAVAFQVVFALSALVMLVRSHRVDPFALATATFLVIPYVFIYDMTVACLGFAIIIWRHWATLTTRDKTVLTLAFLIPNITIVGAFLAPPILLAALYIQTRREDPTTIS